MHVNFVFRHLRESFSSGGGAQEELETESKFLHFSMKNLSLRGRCPGDCGSIMEVN